VESASYLEHLHHDGDALAAAAAAAPAAEVPSCPGWQMTDLVAHAGGVHAWVEQIVSTKAQRYVARTIDPPEDMAALVAWYRDGLHSLLAAFGATGPEEHVWNWRDRGPGPAQFWFRRMAQETAIHRWDAQNAASPGGASAIASDLALDGIDEYLSFVRAWLAHQPVPGLHGSLHLHATDGEGEWTLDLRPEGFDEIREHRKSDTAIRGAASDLYLWMLNRIPADHPRLQRFGGDDVVKAWAELKF
jgi:uncharacterized protein (TIGR03083 family)